MRKEVFRHAVGEDNLDPFAVDETLIRNKCCDRSRIVEVMARLMNSGEISVDHKAGTGERCRICRFTQYETDRSAGSSTDTVLHRGYGQEGNRFCRLIISVLDKIHASLSNSCHLPASYRKTWPSHKGYIRTRR